ncbi:cation diffusion facilitator family transporter [Deinococcus alpinitundrae]|uniref:cation diffusion facilitator family transporter n=1 Tax=Deinococcus alpinitundrae TaxID=468913 RepID=UPI00137A138F|nr:cation diffusion facilitator family transporter [Deinococcus alpinitundrae]
MTHSHNHGENANARQLSIVLGLVGTFLVVEVVYGFLSSSLALLSDAGHMLTDAAALALSLFAIKMGQRPADKQRTFGYRRAEILAAALNAGVLLAIGLYILYEAYLRLRSPVEVQTTPMLIVAVLGLIVNVISARLLVAGSSDSLNVKSAYLEVLGDLLGSVAVIVGAVLIRFTGLDWIDPVLGALIGLWVIPRTWTLLKSSVNVLMEGVPEELNLDALRSALEELPGISEVHDLHVWSVTSGQHNLTAHLVSAQPPTDLLARVQALARRYDLGHSTVQIEAPGLHAESGDHHDHGELHP